jgi:catechol 2,3-dioxygenase-like lactoylglutathione lyase family enzyme
LEDRSARLSRIKEDVQAVDRHGFGTGWHRSYATTVGHRFGAGGVDTRCARRNIAMNTGDSTMDALHPILRVARPTDDLARLMPFYRDGLGLSVLGQFTDHDGFDGVMLGWEGSCYHLEFTRSQRHTAGRAPTADNLLVFYLPERSAWEVAVARMRGNGFEPVAALNPYWDRLGTTFEDPDGYRVVLQQARWTDTASRGR